MSDGNKYDACDSGPELSMDLENLDFGSKKFEIFLKRQKSEISINIDVNLLNLKIWLNDFRDHLFLSTCDYLQLNLMTNLEHLYSLQAPIILAIILHLIAVPLEM